MNYLYSQPRLGDATNHWPKSVKAGIYILKNNDKKISPWIEEEKNHRRLLTINLSTYDDLTKIMTGFMIGGAQ